MAQPHKGNRHTIKLRLEPAVRNEINSRASEVGLSVSQFLADHLALHVDRPDLVYALGQTTLTGVYLPEAHSRSPHTIVRCHEDVHKLLVEKAEGRQVKVATYVADFCRRFVKDDGAAADIEYGYQEVLATSA